MAQLTLSKQALGRLLARIDPCELDPRLCGDPDPPGGEPPDPLPELRRRAISHVLGRPDWVRLNPQPLPPMEYWRSARAARIAIARALTLHEWAQALAADRGERAREMIQGNVSALVDDWCGTSAGHPTPFPWPWGPILRGAVELQPIDLLIAGAQFQKAADALEGSALRMTFESAADRLFEEVCRASRRPMGTSGERESARPRDRRPARSLCRGRCRPRAGAGVGRRPIPRGAARGDR